MAFGGIMNKDVDLSNYPTKDEVEQKIQNIEQEIQNSSIKRELIFTASENNNSHIPDGITYDMNLTSLSYEQLLSYDAIELELSNFSLYLGSNDNMFNLKLNNFNLITANIEGYRQGDTLPSQNFSFILYRTNDSLNYLKSNTRLYISREFSTNNSSYSITICNTNILGPNELKLSVTLDYANATYTLNLYGITF